MINVVSELMGLVKLNNTTWKYFEPTTENGLTKNSSADCLQTRPIDYQQRLVNIRGQLSNEKLRDIDCALKLVFDLT
jgi:mRNA-degrading endonuclease toxin of MazEF toxin-antitoxin module